MKVSQLELARAYIELLIEENTRLHNSIGIVDRLFGDVRNSCSQEIYETNLEALLQDLEDLSEFLIEHQAKIKQLNSYL